MGKQTIQTVSAIRARQDFDLLIQEAGKSNRRFVVEVKGKPLAVILGIGEWQNILETLAELNDPEYLDSIREARREIASGELVTLEELASQVPTGKRGR